MCSVPTDQRPVRRFSWRALKAAGAVVTDAAGSARPGDWVRQPLGVIFWWALPIALGVSTNFLHLPLARAAFIWAVALAWMGTGCVLNALRCGRRHCYVSGPVLWLGAIAAACVSLGFFSGENALSAAVNGALGLAALSLLSERFWGPYIRSSAPGTDRTRPPPAR